MTHGYEDAFPTVSWEISSWILIPKQIFFENFRTVDTVGQILRSLYERFSSVESLWLDMLEVPSSIPALCEFLFLNYRKKSFTLYDRAF